jgi:iron complex outermembrane receptor protein
MNSSVKLCSLLLVNLPLHGWGQGIDLEPVVVSATADTELVPGVIAPSPAVLSAGRASSSDSARLLQSLPGISLVAGGGVSSMPSIHGLADDRVNITVDGMNLLASCPNHMNTPLSYIDPSKVGSVKVFAGVSPVSAGGDSIAGVIQVDSLPLPFAAPGQTELLSGQVGSFYRSNGRAFGANLAAGIASQQVSIRYSASSAQSDNYSAAENFKAAGQAAIGRGWLAGDEVGSSAYKVLNQEVAIAMRNAYQLLELKVGVQDMGLEGFPNQRMDLTGNHSTQFNLRYLAQQQWGTLEAQLYQQHVDHSMDFGPDKRYTYGVAQGMPMNTKSETTGMKLKAEINLAERDILRVGAEYQRYRLDDWWPASMTTTGGMGPNTFWNIQNGQRDRMGVFGEWQRTWNARWMSQLGLRSDRVVMNTGSVQGYNSTATYANDAAAFNALNHQHSDQNWDLSALTRYTPDRQQAYQLAYARKTRSPNLYELYTWSNMSMAAVMNNFAGDGNGYVGNGSLKPEVAHTLSANLELHDPEQQIWQWVATPYASYIENYIDVQRCASSACGGSSNVKATSGYVNLQYVNQNAQLFGIDLSGKRALGSMDGWGKFSMTALLNYTRGTNLSTGDNLYNIMPLNATLGLEQTQGSWNNRVELQAVAAKNQVSQVRNEVATPGYSLVNLRSSHGWKQVRMDFGIDNLLNRYYCLPLGGAYVGQGTTMSKSGIPWGVAVPGMARSIYLAVNYTL